MPDSFEEHVKLMFDLQAVAFAVGRHAHLLVQAVPRRLEPRVHGRAASTTAFHTASHHLDRDDRITDFQKINTYHVSLLPYLLEKLKKTPDGEGNLLDNTLVIYGSAMGNSNVHNHKRCPLFLAGPRRRRAQGQLHVRAADGTPMANAMLATLRGIGVDIDKFGDSTAAIDLNAARARSTRRGGEVMQRSGIRRTASAAVVATLLAARPARGAWRCRRRGCRARRRRGGGAGAAQAGRRRERRARRRHDGAALGGAAGQCRARQHAACRRAPMSARPRGSATTRRCTWPARPDTPRRWRR